MGAPHSAAKMFKGFRYDHLDAAENIFFERQLEGVAAETYDVLYPELLARTLIPTGPFWMTPADETLNWRAFDMYGQAVLIDNYASDMPMVDEAATENRTPVRSYGDGFIYNIQELKAAAKINRALDVDRAMKARELFERKMDTVGAYGDAKAGSKGLLNQSQALSYTLANGATSGTQGWQLKTGLEIAADIAGLVNTIITTTQGVETPDTIALPPAQHYIAATRPLQAGSDTTVLKHVLANSPFLTGIVPWARCTGTTNGGGGPGAGGKDRMVAYKKNPTKVKFFITQEFMLQPPQAINLAYKVPGYGRTAGVIAHYPDSICYADGL